MDPNQKSSFSPEALQLFMGSLKGLDNEEIKKVKELYVVTPFLISISN